VLYRDDNFIYQVDTKEDEGEFFQQYKRVLEERFKQEEIRIVILEIRQIIRGEKLNQKRTEP